MNNPITVETTIDATIQDVWKLWTTPEDIIQWNNPSDDWQTLKVDNDVKEDGRFLFRMQAKDGSDGFDFGGKYDKVLLYERIEYTLDDGRKAINQFIENENGTTVIETFEPEVKTPLDVQKEFCQSVLNNFKRYVEKENSETKTMVTEIRVEFGKTSDELIQMISSTSDEQFNEIPFDGSWSVAQVGEHLLKSYGIVKVLNGQGAETKRLPGKEIVQVKKIFLDFDAKYKSAEALLPTDEPIEKEELLRGLQKRISQINEVIQTKDLTETCIDRPFKGIGDLTRMEWLHVILFHTQRHIHQIENILKSLEIVSGEL